MKALSLYSGGCDGMSLAASWLGIETVAFCDSEPACRAVLAVRHPDRPIFSSDEDVTPDGLRAVGIDPAGIDLIMGGPPCQSASVAGKRLGAADPRNRWPQFIRIVRELRPRWIMAENSPGLLSVDDGRLFGDVLWGLAEAGYALCWDCWGAADVRAPHQRDRLFILGHLADAASECRNWEVHPRRRRRGLANGGLEHPGPTRCVELMPSAIAVEAGYSAGRLNPNRNAGPAQPKLGRDSDGTGAWMDKAARRLEAQKWPAGKGAAQYDWEPPRVAQGIPDRATRLKMIGNACPPQQYLVGLAAIRAMAEAMGYD